MAGRSRSTFGKRQKEMKRLEKRQDKAARKDQRKQEKLAGGGEEPETFSPEEPEFSTDADPDEGE